jgi:predicted phage tail protein
VDALRLAVADAGTTLPTVPAAPASLAAAALSSTAIDLAWADRSDNESGFEIERKTGSNGTWARVLTTGANVSTMDDIGLAASTAYVYRIRAVNGLGTSAWSNEAGATTAAAPVPAPAAPSHLAAAATSATGVRITWWDMSGNETGFEVERKSGASGTWARVRTTGANISAVDDSGLAASTAYTYRARAVNGSGASAYSNEVGVTTPAAAEAPPSAPINFLFSSNAHLRVSVKWTDTSGNETNFEIQRKTGALGVWSTIGTAGANATVYDDWTVTPGLTYVYRARSVNAAGASAWSNSVTTIAW